MINFSAFVDGFIGAGYLLVGLCFFFFLWKVLRENSLERCKTERKGLKGSEKRYKTTLIKDTTKVRSFVKALHSSVETVLLSVGQKILRMLYRLPWNNRYYL